MATVEEKLLKIEEYSEMPDGGRLTELVRGRMIELTRPTYLHGLTCVEIAFALSLWVK